MKMITLVLLFTSIAAGAVNAQSGRVSLKPVLKPGDEARYVINTSADTRVTPSGPNGIASNVHKESAVTVLLRGAATDNGAPVVEAVIEQAAARTTVDGVDRPVSAASLIGQKIRYQLDSMGSTVSVSFPQAASETGLAELLFSLARWAPAAEVSVDQTWGQGAGGESLVGDYGYIAAPSIMEITKGATVSYRLSSVDNGKAVVDGAISFNQKGSSSLTTTEGRIDVTAIAAGKGKARVEFDVNANRILAATTDTSLEGRLLNMAPTREGEKLQPREGSVVETAKFSIKLLQ